jgi:putative DNA primase/helicase
MNKRETIDRIKANFPRELLDLAQWVVWRIESRDDKPTKVPYSINGLRAASDKPSTWATFDAACKAYLAGNYSGVGFMFSEHDPYAGIDFDKCVTPTGEIEPDKLDYVYLLDSYAERSQSSTGLHVIVRATLPPGGRKSTRHNVEMYDRVRFFVVTGDVLDGYTAIEARQQQIEQLHAAIFPVKATPTQPQRSPNAAPTSIDDQELLNRMFASRNGADIQALWRGDTSAHGGNESSADQALCNHLAFWTGNDAGRIDSLFRQSGLYREKWDRNARTGEKYGAGTIARAVADTREVYTPRVHTNGANGHGPTVAIEIKPVEPTMAEASHNPAKADYLLNEGAHDEGNAQCVKQRHVGHFVQNDAFGWMRYTGTHWTAKGGEEAVDRAVVDTLSARIKAALDSGKADFYKDIITKSIPSADKVRGAKYLLRSLVTVPPEDFDIEPDLLNCKNGVVDLHTGKITPHDPSQHFTHCVPVNYAATADFSAWKTWLTDATGGNETIAIWLQMAVGYSLTGHTREEVLFYLYGLPRSGKGTFTETLTTLLGKPLSAEVDFGIFTAPRTGDSQNFDLAPLKSCRIVMASESNAYERFNAAKIKALTGGNDIYCAHKHKEHFNYRPLFKIWLSSNQPVNADPDDDAVWGRIHEIEFPHSHLGSEDKSLKLGMKTPAMLESVLAWAVEGAMKWYALGSAGLPELGSSRAIKAEQRQSLDNVQGWLDECCMTGGDGFCSNSILYLSYERWCKENGFEAKKQKAFPRR